MTYEALQFAMRVGRETSQLNQAEYQITGVYTTRSKTCCEPRDNAKQDHSSRVSCFVIP